MLICCQSGTLNCIVELFSVFDISYFLCLIWTYDVYVYLFSYIDIRYLNVICKCAGEDISICVCLAILTCLFDESGISSLALLQ